MSLMLKALVLYIAATACTVLAILVLLPLFAAGWVTWPLVFEEGPGQTVVVWQTLTLGLPGFMVYCFFAAASALGLSILSNSLLKKGENEKHTAKRQ